MDADQQALVEHVRAALALALSPDESVREVAMFGGRSFMVSERLAVSALPRGDLLVRVALADDARLVASPGARRAEMGAGRSMGEGWIHVDSSALVTGLSAWLDAAIAHNRA